MQASFRLQINCENAVVVRTMGVSGYEPLASYVKTFIVLYSNTTSFFHTVRDSDGGHMVSAYIICLIIHSGQGEI